MTSLICRGIKFLCCLEFNDGDRFLIRGQVVERIRRSGFTPRGGFVCACTTMWADGGLPNVADSPLCAVKRNPAVFDANHHLIIIERSPLITDAETS